MCFLTFQKPNRWTHSHDPERCSRSDVPPGGAAGLSVGGRIPGTRLGVEAIIRVSTHDRLGAGQWLAGGPANAAGYLTFLPVFVCF